MRGESDADQIGSQVASEDEVISEDKVISEDEASSKLSIMGSASQNGQGPPAGTLDTGRS